MTFYWKIPYWVRLRAPWVTPGDAASGPSTDIVLARNSNGKFILPATLIKGNLRAAVDALVGEKQVSADIRDVLFGTPSATRCKGKPEHPWRVANEPEYGELIFGDLVADKEAPDEGARTQRVEIDPDLKAAREGHLLFVECPFRFGTEVTFAGDVILWCHAKISKDDAVALLKKALARVFAIGGMKSVGFGRVEKCEVEGPVAVVPAMVKAPALNLAMEYRIDRPFIVDAVRHSGNLSVGSDIIPGSALKAMLARGCKAAGIDAERFLSALNISHAAPNGHNPLPLSLSVAGNKVFCNLDGVVRPGYHRFASDLKKSKKKDVRKALGAGWATHGTRLSGRSRTAIESSSLTAKFEPGDKEGEGEGLLFSQMAVVPDGLIWRGTISAPADLDMLGQILGLLGPGLPGLGKTGAVLTGKAQALASLPTPTGTLNLTLTSDACLFKPQDAVGADVGVLYRDYFKAQGFELKHFFARQVLKGGYLALRYPVIDGKYMPWVLTGTGSVFRVIPGDGAGIDDILANGLPPADGLSDDWRRFPFLRENGFGRVVHNILDHSAMAQGIAL